MPTIILENVSAAAYEHVARLAADRKTTPAEEAARLLEEAAGQEAPAPYPLPELIPSEEISAPFDLPLPGPGVPVQTVPGKAPLPDLLLELPEEQP